MRQSPTKGVKSRGNGQGSAIKTKTGWKAIAVVAYNKEGNPIRRTKSGFATKTEALAYISTLRKEKPKVDTNIKLINAIEKWHDTLDVSQSTLWCYQAGLKLFSELNYVNISDIEIDDLQECISSTDKGKRTRQNAKVALGLVYKWAIPRGYAKLNMAQYLRVGDGEAPNKVAFSDADLEKIKKAADTLRFAKIIYCHCYLGFRPSALLDLTAESYHDGAFVGGIKTEAGKNRTVTVSPKIQRYVDDLLAEAKRGYVFGEKGKQISLAVYRARFYETLETLGIRNENHRYTPHTCRHTFATLLKKVNAPDKDKLELMGHTDASMLRYYQDVSIDDLKAITSRL